MPFASVSHEAFVNGAEYTGPEPQPNQLRDSYGRGCLLVTGGFGRPQSRQTTA